MKLNKIKTSSKLVLIILLILLIIVFFIIVFSYYLNYPKTVIGNIDTKNTTTINDISMQNVNMDFCSSKGINIKLNNISFNNSTIRLVFELKFDKNIEKDYSVINFTDMIITDENNNVLFCDDKDTYEKFCKQNNIEFTNNIYDSNIILTSDYSDMVLDQTENTIKVLYTLNSNNKYPNSQKLFFKFSNIILADTLMQTSESNSLEKQKGTWNLNLHLSDDL